MTDKTEETKLEAILGTCVICGRSIKRSEADKWVYHVSRGFVCLHHHGVKQWYDDLLKQAQADFLAGLPPA